MKQKENKNETNKRKNRIGKYYYLRLKDSFFYDDKVMILESMEEGEKLIVFLLKLYLKSLKNNGKLMVEEGKGFSKEMLASITRTDLSVVKKAFKVFENLSLIELLEDEIIYLNDIELLVGESSTEAERKRHSRQKILEEKSSNGQKAGHLSDKSHVENREYRIEYKDKRKEKEYKEKEKDDKLINNKLIKDKLINQTEFGKNLFTKQLLLEGKIKGEVEAKLSDEIFKDLSSSYEEKDLIIAFYYTIKRLPKNLDNVLAYIKKAVEKNIETIKKERDLNEKLQNKKD